MRAGRKGAAREAATASAGAVRGERAQADGAARQPVLRMQRAVGNAAVQRVLGPRPGAAGRVQRWESREHVRLGEESGGAETGLLTLAAHDADLPQRREPVERWPAEWRALYEAGTPEQRRVLRGGLTYGEVVALTGDMYAGFAELSRAPLREVYDLVPLIHGHATTEQQERATGGRYLALAKENESHFSHTAPGKSNQDRWRDLHLQALAAARAGDANLAWTLNAMADHYLTDAFSGGHVRTPRSQLMGSNAGNIRSKILHDLDNTHGVRVRNGLGEEWVAYGDERMDDAANRDNLAIVQEAVRLSKQDVARALAAGSGGPAPDEDARFAAEELIPRPVDPSRDRWTGRVTRWRKGADGSPVPVPDDFSAMTSDVISREGPDVVEGFVTDDDRVRDWIARHAGVLGRQTLPDRRRLGEVLLSGVAGAEDLAALRTLLDASTEDRAELGAALRPAARGISRAALRNEVMKLLAGIG
ncbi:MAG: hypothetical protein AB1941_26020 [Gemmatimonadota bacterium]